MPELLTTEEAAVYLGGKGRPLRPQTLAYWRTIGEGPEYMKIGSLVRYTPPSLDAYLESCRRKPGRAA